MHAVEMCLRCSFSYNRQKRAVLLAQRLAKAWLTRLRLKQGANERAAAGHERAAAAHERAAGNEKGAATHERAAAAKERLLHQEVSLGDCAAECGAMRSMANGVSSDQMRI